MFVEWGIIISYIKYMHRPLKTHGKWNKEKNLWILNYFIFFFVFWSSIIPVSVSRLEFLNKDKLLKCGYPPQYCSAFVPPGQKFEGGLKWPKKVYNGSDYSESQKKWRICVKRSQKAKILICNSAHEFRTGKQFSRGAQWRLIWQIDCQASCVQELCVSKSHTSGFWTFCTSKLTNFKTRLWTRATCILRAPVDSPWVVDNVRHWNFSICY